MNEDWYYGFIIKKANALEDSIILCKNFNSVRFLLLSEKHNGTSIMATLPYRTTEKSLKNKIKFSLNNLNFLSVLCLFCSIL